ncbi:hypothetical protein ACEPAH_9324 [Sanghuangporus vaninii]
MVRCPPSPQIKPAVQRMDGYTNQRAPSPNGADGQADLLMDLHALHADEFAYLSQRLTDFERRCEESWTYRSYAMFKQFAHFVAKTWIKAAWELIFLPTTLMDRVALILLTSVATVIMALLLPWCILCKVPISGKIFDYCSRRFFNGLSIVNASYPSMFEDLTYEQIRAAKTHLSQPIEQSPSRVHRRVFNLDASKLLLQCAALIYERTSSTTHRAAATALAHSTGPRRRQTEWGLSEARPGAHIAQFCGDAGADAVMEELHGHSKEENTICSIAHDELGLTYTTISELNCIGSAFCGLFWDPHDTFIIVVFKGTTPSDFAEWTTDFTFQLREAGLWLRGFGKVHDGFMDKIFPKRIPPGSRMPYSTIVESIKAISARLLEQSPGKKINVWITGHSLGCALASLVYSRLVSEPHEYGENVVMRDAYLFASPILCDVESANAFNGRMNHFSDFPRTMWRITNGKDCVATSLPDAGDNAEWSLSPWNLFSYAHLGCEIKLRDAPGRCEVSGSHVTPGTHVIVESEFHSDVAKGQESPLRAALIALQDLPVIGRLLAHAPGFYWASLQGVGADTCEWVYD